MTRKLQKLEQQLGGRLLNAKAKCLHEYLKAHL